MSRIEFSRAAARIVKKIKSFEEATAFRDACRKAEASNPENPLEALEPKFSKYFA